MADTTPPASPEVPEPAAAAAPAAPAAPAASPYAQQPYATGPKTNVLAIISLVASILSFSIIGVITGHIALSQIKKRAEGGRGLAIAGLIIGYLGCLGWIIFWVSIIGLSIWGASAGSYYDYSY